MIAPLLASLLLVVQNRPALDSATVTRVLNQLKGQRFGGVRARR